MIKQQLQASLDQLQKASEVKEYVLLEPEFLADLLGKMRKMTAAASEADIALYNANSDFSYANRAKSQEERDAAIENAQRAYVKHSRAYHSLSLMVDDLWHILKAAQENQGATAEEVKQIARFEQAAYGADMSTNLARSPYAQQHRESAAKIKADVAARNGCAQ